VQLDDLPFNTPAIVARVDWDCLSPIEARRMRDLGFAEGVEVEMLHRGWFLFRDPLAVRVGRMTAAVRSALAAAVEVTPAPHDARMRAPG
jgi:ferrous iron transport protein A